VTWIGFSWLVLLYRSISQSLNYALARDVSCHGIATSYVGSSVSMHISGALIRVDVHLKLNGRSFAPNTDLRSLRIRISWPLG
jgi:hypothetical protein